MPKQSGKSPSPAAKDHAKSAAGSPAATRAKARAAIAAKDAEDARAARDARDARDAKSGKRRARDGAPFWETKSLSEMSRAEWESLCDGCGKCCLHKYEYEDTGELEYTNVACRFLDLKKCNCTQYKRRHELVEDCIALTPDMVGNLSWLPASCAYRRLDEGKNLPPWHPLITGDPGSVHKAGVAVGGRIVSEADVDDPEDHIVDWIR